MIRNYVYAGFKSYELLLDLKFLLFCRNVYFYSHNSSNIRFILLSIFCKITFKNVYLRDFSFDDYSIAGMHPYVYSRELAANILFDQMDIKGSRSLASYFQLLLAKSLQIPLENIIKNLLFAHFISHLHSSTTLFPIKCDPEALNLFKRSPQHQLESNNIHVQYNVFYLQNILYFLGSIHRLIKTIARCTLNLFSTFSTETSLQLCDYGSQNIIFTYENCLNKHGHRSIHSLSLPQSFNFPNNQPFVFILLGVDSSKQRQPNMIHISAINSILRFTHLSSFIYFFYSIFKTLSRHSRVSVSCFARSLVYTLDAVHARAFLSLFTKLENIYFYDDHPLLRGLNIISYLDNTHPEFRSHQIQYSVLPFANPIMMQMADYFHCFEPHFLKSFIHPKLPTPTILQEEYPFILPKRPISTEPYLSHSSKFLIGYLDESIQFNDMFAGISYESELLNFELLARFVLSRDNFYICFKPQFARNSVKVIFKNNPYLKLLVQRNKLVEFKADSSILNSRNNLLPSFAFKHVDLCIGSCIGGTAAYECAQSGKRAVLIHSDYLQSPFKKYSFKGKVVFSDIKSILSILSSYNSKHEFLSSDLGLW